MEPYSNVVLIKIALILCLTLVLMSLFFIDFEVCVYSTKAVSTVSGYYGPGAYLGFLATSLSAILCYEWLRPLRPLGAILKDRAQGQEHRDNLQAQVLREAKPSPYDAAYVGMMAYFVIAYGDYWVQAFRTNGSATQCSAAAMIIHRSINILGGIACCGITIDSLLFDSGRIDYSSTRLSLWILIPIMYQYAADFLGFMFFDPSSNPYITILVGVVYQAAIIAITSFMIRNVPFGLLFQPCQLIFSRWLHADQPTRYCTGGNVYRSIFPIGSSYLSDLDQAAALATGLLVALWPLVTSDVRRDVMLALGIGESQPPVARTGNRA
jgi:hypothetical protein